jgi:diguanylate cyclase (GGDEF)-like protein/PAS domain S-box-containing protein
MNTDTQKTGKLSLLLVEDDPVNREILRRVILDKVPDIELYTAENGITGLELYKQHAPEIVVTDVNLPTVNGILMAGEIRALNPSASIIVITANDDMRYVMDAIKIGITHYVLKPIEHQLFIETIDNCIERIELERRVKEQNEYIRKLSRVVEQGPSAVVVTDADGIIEYVNPKFTELTGYTPDEAIGKNPRILKTDEVPSEVYENLWNTIKSGQLWRGEFLNRKKNGELYWEFSSISPLVDEEGNITHFISMKEDITRQKLVEKELQESEKRYKALSITDSLTKLFNSRHFFSQMRYEVERANRYGHPLGLILLDIDNFKKYNDTYGHLEGDKVLAVLANSMRENLRNIDSAYRYGGEEFTVLLPETDTENALVVAERIRKSFSSSILVPVPGTEVHMTISVGVGQYIIEEKESAFLERVDKAMYCAKESGKNKVCRAA